MCGSGARWECISVRGQVVNDYRRLGNNFLKEGEEVLKSLNYLDGSSGCDCGMTVKTHRTITEKLNSHCM